MQVLVDDVKTDEQIYELFVAEMLPKWLKTLTELWTAFGKTPTPDMLEIYKSQLGEIPFELLGVAVRRAVRDHKYSNVPTVHDVWEALRKEMGLSVHEDIVEAIGHWEEKRFERVLYRFPVAVETEVER